MNINLLDLKKIKTVDKIEFTAFDDSEEHYRYYDVVINKDLKSNSRLFVTEDCDLVYYKLLKKLGLTQRIKEEKKQDKEEKIIKDQEKKLRIKRRDEERKKQEVLEEKRINAIKSKLNKKEKIKFEKELNRPNTMTFMSMPEQPSSFTQDLSGWDVRTNKEKCLDKYEKETRG